MLNLKELSSFQKQTSAMSEKRHLKSEEKCKLGFECLAQAEQSHFRDKDLLNQACDAFAEAISYDRQAAAPYFGMGYILFLLMDYPMAIQYLKEAGKLNPDNPDVPLLLGYINNPRPTLSEVEDAPVLQPKIGLISELSDGDYDLLYDEVEALIHDEVRKLVSGMLRPPIPSFKDVEIAKLEATKVQQQGLLHEIFRQIHIIDEEIDTAELRSKLKPIENAVKRTEQALNISQEMVNVCLDLDGLSERLPSLIAQIGQANSRDDLRGIEHLQDVIMDMCDQIADRLDEMDQKKYPVQPLVTKYEGFIAEVEKLSEHLDDALETFA